MRNEELKRKWLFVQEFINTNFADGDEVDLDGILFLIGVQELGQGKRKFKKDEKLDLMHIAICKLLSYYGHYKLIGLDEHGWPHYELIAPLPTLKAGEQALLMREAIVQYFEQERIIDFTN
ncbi:MAG: hypothetical protein LAT76_05870 [Schleiferiaceae bacterium]|nr:hypothetical protein [Schleiferiaceae bacterium]